MINTIILFIRISIKIVWFNFHILGVTLIGGEIQHGVKNTGFLLGEPKHGTVEHVYNITGEYISIGVLYSGFIAIGILKCQFDCLFFFTHIKYIFFSMYKDSAFIQIIKKIQMFFWLIF